MKAWTLVRHGDPRTAFELRDHPDPVPGQGEVLIRAEGFGLNFADTMAVRGLYRDAPPPPCVIGYETVGRVERISADADPTLLGKRVAAITRFGGYAGMITTDHRSCVVIDEGTPLGEALALTTQGCTAWYAARVLCPLRSGERVLVHSAAGGVGQLLVQLAKHAGCEIFALVGIAEKRAAVEQMGATHVIDRSTGDYATALRSILGDHRLDVSFNAVGGTSFKKDLRLLGSGGRLVLYGGAERSSIGVLGTLRFVWRMGLILPIFLMMKSRSLLGVNMLRIGESRPDLLAECLHGASKSYSEGILRPLVHHTYDAAQLPEAHIALAGGSTIGKVAVKW